MKKIAEDNQTNPPICQVSTDELILHQLDPTNMTFPVRSHVPNGGLLHQRSANLSFAESKGYGVTLGALAVAWRYGIWNCMFSFFYCRINIISCPAQIVFLYAFVSFGWNLVGNHEGDLYADAGNLCGS